jgi:hypothetical protein
MLVGRPFVVLSCARAGLAYSKLLIAVERRYVCRAPTSRRNKVAQRVSVTIVSDLSGDEVKEGKGETIEFAYRGTNYQIDLTSKEAAGFDKSIAMYVEHATRVGKGTRTSGSSSRSSGTDTKAIRDWANANGYEVGDRRRIPASVKDAYAAAN